MSIFSSWSGLALIGVLRERPWHNAFPGKWSDTKAKYSEPDCPIVSSLDAVMKALWRVLTRGNSMDEKIAVVKFQWMRVRNDRRCCEKGEHERHDDEET
jgi:hypothetical protein